MAISCSYSEYINNWLNEANQDDKCYVIIYHNNREYTAVNWEVGWVHLTLSMDGNTNLFVNTNNQPHICFQKVFK